MLIPRPYQTEAIDASAKFLLSGQTGGICILPTGSGKSLVIAELIRALGSEKTLVLQPSKEILKQNYDKYIAYGFYASMFSASLKKKEISRTVFATIGSVIGHKTLFSEFKYVIIDECHLVRPVKVKSNGHDREEQHSMYSEFFAANPQMRLMGMTATPYRLNTDGFGGSMLKFITRTRPRLFNTVVYYVQNKLLFDQGYLAKLQYYHFGPKFDRSKIKTNTTGADFDQRSLELYYDGIGLAGTLIACINKIKDHRRNMLVFVQFIKEARALARQIPGAEYVSGEMPAEQRDDILDRFKSGKLKILINVGIVTIGYDKPDLECCILAFTTMSLAKYYQVVGRVIRIHPDKKEAWVIDLCGNVELFGRVEDLRIVDEGKGKWAVYSKDRQLTNKYFGEVRSIPQKKSA